MRLVALSETLPTVVDAQLRRDAGLARYEYYVLSMLSESPDRSRLMSQLAIATNGSLSRLSHAVSRLESNGWITRRQLESDRRATIATLTDAGMQKVVESAPGHVEEVRRQIFDQLSPDQVERLSSALDPVLSALCVPPVGDVGAECDATGPESAGCDSPQ